MPSIFGASLRRRRHPKWLLRQALNRPLPDCTIQRRKQGFTFPWQEWLKGIVLRNFDEKVDTHGQSPWNSALRAYFDEKLAAPNGWKQILQPKSVQWWHDAYIEGWTHWPCFWAIYFVKIS